MPLQLTRIVGTNPAFQGVRIATSRTRTRTSSSSIETQKEDKYHSIQYLGYKKCRPFGSAEPNSSWQGDAWSGGGDAHPPCGPLRHGRITTSKLYLKPLNRPRTRTRTRTRFSGPERSFSMPLQLTRIVGTNPAFQDVQIATSRTSSSSSNPGKAGLFWVQHEHFFLLKPNDV